MRLFGPRYPERRTVVVNFVDDQTQAIRGVLWESTREHLVLKDAEALAVKQTPGKMDGDVLIYRSRVLYLQVLAP